MLDPAFLEAVERSPTANFRLAQLAGYRHPQQFSKDLHDARGVPLRDVPLLKNVAALVGHPPSKIFVGETSAEAR